MKFNNTFTRSVRLPSSRGYVSPDAASFFIMKTANTVINGESITAFADGSIERQDTRYKSKKIVRTFGSRNAGGYLVVSIRGKLHYMHLIIANAFDLGITIRGRCDHINGDRSDNRIENLRILTHQENTKAFCRKRKIATSRFRGVSWSKRDRKWKTCIQINGKNKTVGGFENEIEAARAYDRTAIGAGYLPEALNFLQK